MPLLERNRQRKTHKKPRKRLRKMQSG